MTPIEFIEEELRHNERRINYTIGELSELNAKRKTLKEVLEKLQEEKPNTSQLGLFSNLKE